MGTTLQAFAQAHKEEITDPSFGSGGILAAIVDNKLKELEFKMLEPHTIRFIGYGHPDGRRTYIRTLCFVLQNVISKMFPDKVLAIDYSLPSGLYCELREQKELEDGRPDVYFLTDEQIEAIRQAMSELIQRDLPITKSKMTAEETQGHFAAKHQLEKINLMHTLGRFR